MEGEEKPWEVIPEKRQKEIGTALNDKALRAIGYIPVSEIKVKIAGEKKANSPIPINAGEYNKSD